jgi:hypothetical protein
VYLKIIVTELARKELHDVGKSPGTGPERAIVNLLADLVVAIDQGHLDDGIPFNQCSECLFPIPCRLRRVCGELLIVGISKVSGTGLGAP